MSQFWKSDCHTFNDKEVKTQNSFLRVSASLFVFALIATPINALPFPRTAIGDERWEGRQLISSSVDEFASELDGARESFLNVDGRTAAFQVRCAAIKTHEVTKDAAESGIQAVTKSVGELESLAKAIEQRRLASVRSLDEVFARANYAFAKPLAVGGPRSESAGATAGRR